MDSKLPKPTGLKRPMALVKNILPMDRIKIGGNNTQSSNDIGLDNHRLQPLSRSRDRRGASPDGQKATTIHSRAKLRRSRSAFDLREMRGVKRPELTLAPIPAKTARLNFNTCSATSTSATAASLKKPTVSHPQLTTVRGKTTVNNTKKNLSASSSSTSVSSTGATKPINKRIPPYDFKARYNDLLEKHKVLKEKYELKCEQMLNLENMPEQLEETQSELMSTQEKFKNAETECECLKRQVKSQTIKIENITLAIEKTKEQLDKMTKEHDTMKTDFKELSTEAIDLRERNAKLTKENDYLKDELLLSKDQLFTSNMERKELHNVVMDLRGNIRVFCRVRPPLDFEQERMVCSWNYIDESTLEILNPDVQARNKVPGHTFSFDQVFHHKSTQEEIFELVSPLIQSAMDGYNVCIFAYGQTGSGKTYTMDGLSTQPGVIPRTVDLLFEAVKNYKRLGWDYEIKVTFLEIYNEVLYDLLSNEAKDMDIRMVKNSKNDIYVSNITEETVTNAERLRQLMQTAKMNRATAATVGNERSSRSHAVTRIELIGGHAEKNEISIGTINLVDLAGSESPKTSIRMNETKNINRSLSELTNVILALLQKQDHIPYRNSKLTHLLMPSLGGNSKTLMFINVAPFVDCYTESVKSLRFASSVNSCKMTKAKRNRFLNTSNNNSGDK